MKVIAINASPRKEWNTATLLQNALKGAVSKGAQTEIYHLYDYYYTGCISCFACKRTGGSSYGKCAVKDELRPILESVQKADALILGSPIYFGCTTGMMRSFLERLLFPNILYDADHSTIFGRRMPVGLIYTMNAEEKYYASTYIRNERDTSSMLERILGPVEALASFETYQFDDYSKYETSAFSEPERRERREKVFPKDCRKAFAMGQRLAAHEGK